MDAFSLATRPQGHKILVGTLLLVCAAIGAGLSVNANANPCPQPKVLGPKTVCPPQNPPPPHPINGTLNTATITGMSNPSSQSISSHTSLQGVTGTQPGSLTNDNDTVEAWTPHTYSKVHVYEQSGVDYAQVYIYTQSQYAPDGDSGTFVFDAEGNLVSGDPDALSRLQNEAQEADPQIAVQVSGVLGWFIGHSEQIEGCGDLAGGAFLIAAMPWAGAAVQMMAGLTLFGGGLTGFFTHAATECF